MVQGGMKGVWAGRVAVVALISVGLTGCQALKDVLPTKSSETPRPEPTQAPVSVPVVLAPAPSPTPVLGGPSSPSPSPTPSSSPAPSTPSTPTGGSCSLPASNSPDAGCSMQSSNFLGAVDKAITKVTEQQPSLFDFTTFTCTNCYYVRNQDAFVAAVVANLTAAGYCALYDGEELAVKNTNSYNEQFDILVSSGYIRRGDGSYRSTCNPSWF
jgi:hypothetical protein